MSTLAGLSLRDLEYAVEVARLRHFGRAAERCGVSQPALSEQIRKLEALLGTPLFERANRRVTPTPRGEVLLRRAEQLVEQARELLEAARGAGEPLTGPLRLGVIPTLGPYYLPGVLPRLRQRFPRLALRLEETRTPTLLQELRAGALDAGLLALPVPGDALRADPLFFEPFRLVCPADHALARGRLPPLDALGGPELLLLEDGHCLRDQALSLCPARAGSGARFASSLEMLRHMIAAGEGYSLMPALATSGPDGLSVSRTLPDAAAGRQIGLVWRASDPREAEFRQLAGVLRDLAGPELHPLTPPGS